VTGTAAYPTRTTLTFTPTAGSLILTVTGSVTQAQLEAGSFVTSYIPTVAASAVRSADVCSITGANFSGFYNPLEGTIFLKASTALPGNSSILYVINDTTNQNQILALPGTSSFVVSGLNVQQANLNTGFFTANAASMVASAYKLNDFATSKNGLAVVTDNTGTLPIVTQLSIGNRSSSNQLNGHIAYLRYFKKRLPNVKLQSLTA
jgi:hypothetical protein